MTRTSTPCGGPDPHFQAGRHTPATESVASHGSELPPSLERDLVPGPSGDSPEGRSTTQSPRLWEARLSPSCPSAPCPPSSVPSADPVQADSRRGPCFRGTHPTPCGPQAGAYAQDVTWPLLSRGPPPVHLRSQGARCPLSPSLPAAATWAPKFPVCSAPSAESQNPAVLGGCEWSLLEGSVRRPRSASGRQARGSLVAREAWVESRRPFTSWATPGQGGSPMPPSPCR